MATKRKKPGFNPYDRPTRPRATVTFPEDHWLAGLEFEAWLDGPISLMFGLDEIDQLASVEEQVALVRQWADEILISWNVIDHDDKPVPATGDGIMTQDLSTWREILGGWVQAIHVARSGATSAKAV